MGSRTRLLPFLLRCVLLLPGRQRQKLRWDHARELAEAKERSLREGEALLAKVEAGQAALRSLEAKARAESLSARESLEQAEAQSAAKDAELVAARADARVTAERLAQEMATRLLAAEASAITCRACQAPIKPWSFSRRPILAS